VINFWTHQSLPTRFCCTGFYAPYRKPLNKPIFIHTDSNHQKVIKDEIPKMISKRLSNNTSSETNFKNAKPLYLHALENSGYKDFEFTFQQKQNPRKSKRKYRKILYCNLPWNIAVKTNIGKQFSTLVDKFKNTPQGKYINRHVIKLSYSTMQNLK
jgi:hypothetical protein